MLWIEIHRAVVAGDTLADFGEGPRSIAGSSGSQFGSATVSSFPSVSPAPIAVIGRQNA